MGWAVSQQINKFMTPSIYGPLDIEFIDYEQTLKFYQYRNYVYLLVLKSNSGRN